LYDGVVPRVSESERPLRRKRLVDAAWRCLERGSFAELRVEDVCQEAHLSKGSFYGYFDSKRDLMFELVDDDMSVLAADARDGTGGGGQARLQAFARSILFAGHDGARTQLRADVWAAAQADPALESRLRDGIARRRALVRGWVEDAIADGTLADVPANALASILLALADGLGLHHRLDPDGFRWENVRIAVEALLSGLAPA
jgi:AcrR family transcriptional regulator